MLFYMLKNNNFGGFIFMKLKIKNLNKLIDKLSGREIDLYLYLIKRQNDLGQVDAIRYKDVMLELHMPKSTFYGALYELEENKFININWGSGYGEFDIIVLDNIFKSKENYNEGYLNLNLDLILSKMFIKLHVSMKKLLLRLLGIQAGTRKVKVTKEMLKQYKVYYCFEELKSLFNIIDYENGWLFTLRKEFRKKSHNTYFLQYQHKLINYCKRYKIAYTLEELIDSVNVIVNNRQKMSKVQKALDYIRDSIHILQPKLINHACTNF